MANSQLKDNPGQNTANFRISIIFSLNIALCLSRTSINGTTSRVLCHTKKSVNIFIFSLFHIDIFLICYVFVTKFAIKIFCAAI